MKSKIRNPKKMRQLIDFKGLELDGGIYPTDIDGLIELRNREYISLKLNTVAPLFLTGKGLLLKEW